jgi:hypothetical protein
MIRLIAAIAIGVLIAAGGAYAAQSVIKPASDNTPVSSYDGR